MSLEGILNKINPQKIKDKIKKFNKSLISLGFIGAISLTGCMNIKGPVFEINHGRYIKNLYDRKTPSRLGVRPVPSIATNYLDLKNLGKHSYLGKGSEKNGLVYTEKAGIIDISHVRWCADTTAYLSAKFYENLQQGKEEFSFKLEEPSIYHIKIKYPENWGVLDKEKKMRIIYKNSIEFGKYMSFTASIWHEILTWFGYKSYGIFYEFPSAFSWEDIISNLIGVHIGAKALDDENDFYQESVSLNLEKELRKLLILSKEKAEEKLCELREWYTPSLLTLEDVKKKNFDIGLDDGYITPIVYKNRDSEPLKDFPVPNLNAIEKDGFKIQVIIQPKEWEKGKILKIVEQERYISPEKDFPRIMQEIKEDGKRIYGERVDKP
jgi:hypothetical protein